MKFTPAAEVPAVKEFEQEDAPVSDSIVFPPLEVAAVGDPNAALFASPYQEQLLSAVSLLCSFASDVGVELSNQQIYAFAQNLIGHRNSVDYNCAVAQVRGAIDAYIRR